MGAYKFILDGLTLPITPSSLEVRINNNNKTITLINDGEVNILKNAGLTDINFEFLIPSNREPFSLYERSFIPPYDYLEKIEKLKTSKAPFDFYVIRDESASADYAPNSHHRVSIEEYTIKEDANEHGKDYYVTVSLKQYKSYGTKVITTTESGTSTQTASSRDSSYSGSATSGSGTTAKTYTIKSGDSLWSISKTQLGDGNRWKEIYTLNADAIENAAKSNGRKSSSNGSYIYVGTVLKLP